MELKRSPTGLSEYQFQMKVAEKGPSKRVKFPSAYFQAPQFYYTDQDQIFCRPRQMQAYLCGSVTFPIPVELPRFTREQTLYSEFLRNAVLVGDVFVAKQQFADLVRQATRDNSFGPDHKDRPSKSLYDQKNVTTPEQALDRFDSKYNRSISGRLSLARSLSGKLSLAKSGSLTSESAVEKQESKEL